MSTLSLLIVFLVLSALVSSVFVFGVRALSEDVATSVISRAEDVVVVGMKDFSSVLVTGGAGFIGSHLVDRLMDMGCFVRVVDNLSSGSLENVQSWFGHPRFDLVRGDLKDLAVAGEAVKGLRCFSLGCQP